MKGPQLTVKDFVQILRTRWKIIGATTAVAILCALAYSLLVPPKYEASTRLFVATTAETNATQINDGALFAQRRVLSYIKLLTGELLAQRTIDKLNLDMSAADLQRQITAVAPTDTVLIDVTARDPSPVRARDIANALSDEFVLMAAGLETPDVGAKPNAQVTVQQRAAIPNGPAAPTTKQILALAAVLGALIGVILALVRDRLDNTVKSPDAVEKATGVGVVGDIPFDALRRTEPLITFESDRSPIAEAFRELRINAQFLEAAQGPRVLLVASPRPGEGRTTTAINLSLALAEAEYNVVVVDGDLRRPRIAPLLHLDGQVGLSTVLMGEASPREALQRTHIPRLTALASGAITANPAGILGSQAARDLFTELSGEFDYVIVDTPPLLVTDAAILARSSQAVLMVARFGQTKRQQLADATNALRQAGAPLIGAVLTMTPQRKRNPIEDGYYGIANSTRRDSQAERGRWRRSQHKK